MPNASDDLPIFPIGNHVGTRPVDEPQVTFSFEYISTASIEKNHPSLPVGSTYSRFENFYSQRSQRAEA